MKISITRNVTAFKGGSYSMAATALVLAILIVFNLFVAALPTSMTKFDISSSKLYSITGNTKAVVNQLQQDVTIYWVVQADAEDTIIENLLSKYESLSSHIEIVKKNPDVFPTFTAQYTDVTVPNNSLIVESGDRYRYISYDDIYEYETDYYSYSYVTGFDGEGAITSAIDYVVTEKLPILYLLEGHGEGDLPSTFSETLEKENVELKTVSLLNVDFVPEEADAVMIYAPQSDISEIELDMLRDYTENGGKLLVMAGPVYEVEFTNLNSILEDYGVILADGIVVESSRDHYLTGYPYSLMPDMESTDITDPLINDGYAPIIPLAQGLSITGYSAANITSLLTTSYYSYSKAAGFDLTTYDFEEDDTEGPFSVALSIETESDGKIIWFSASDFLDDMYNAYSSGANVDLTMNAISDLIGERDAISIRSKSLNYNYLTISEDSAAMLKLRMIVIFPLAYLCVGMFIILRKRGKQNESA